MGRTRRAAEIRSPITAPTTMTDGRGQPELVLEENVTEDVETGLAAPSQGQMRPPWPHSTKET